MTEVYLLGLLVAYAKLADIGVQVIGVSSDDSADQKKFQEKYKLPFTLVADTDKKVMDAFGVPHTLGFASRQAFLVHDGKIVWGDGEGGLQQAQDHVNLMLAGERGR